MDRADRLHGKASSRWRWLRHDNRFVRICMVTVKKSKLTLIADDYDNAAALMAALVRQATQYEAQSARDGREVLEMARRRRPDAAILDIDMPQMSGIDVALALRSEYGERRPLLIALTGAPTDDARLAGLFDHVFRKPIGTLTLFRVLEDG